MAVGVAARQHIPPLGEWIVIRIEQVLPAKIAIARTRAALTGQEKILRNCIGLIPRPYLVFVWAPWRIMLHRMRRKMRQSGVRSVLEDFKGVHIANIFVRINESADKLVVAISRKTVLFVVIPGNLSAYRRFKRRTLSRMAGSFRIGIHASERGDPLAESATGSKAVSACT